MKRAVHPTFVLQSALQARDDFSHLQKVTNETCIGVRHDVQLVYQKQTGRMSMDESSQISRSRQKIRYGING